MVTPDESITSERIRDEMRTPSRAADKSVLWVGVAEATTALGGPRARRAALRGLASIDIASSTVNIIAKPAYSRVHTGVHYPGDVVAGLLTGMTAGRAGAFAVTHVIPEHH